MWTYQNIAIIYFASHQIIGPCNLILISQSSCIESKIFSLRFFPNQRNIHVIFFQNVIIFYIEAVFSGTQITPSVFFFIRKSKHIYYSPFQTFYICPIIINRNILTVHQKNLNFSILGIQKILNRILLTTNESRQELSFLNFFSLKFPSFLL